MARFERGKSKYEIHQYGHAIGVREWMGDEYRLMGYSMFADAATASAELDRLLREKSAEGFRPKDDEAKNLAVSLKLEGPGKKAAPALPLRQDIHVYNEATGFAIAALKLAGKGMEDGDKKWMKAVNDGLLMPSSLYQDDPFCIRVVAGDALTAQESEEWVGRVDWQLKLADGKLCISGGAEWLYEGYDRTEAQDDNFLRIVELPPGSYRATLYTYLSGVNGSACLDGLAGGHGKAEPLGQWFRRTRPGESFPEWLVYRCVAYPDTDPGHEIEWQNHALPDTGTMPEFVGFLLHLEPAELPAAPGKARTTGGWFSDSESARKPERCPAGLLAKEVIGHAKRVKGKWFWPSEVFASIEGRELRPIKGGEVEIPLDRLGDVYRLARFCHQHARPELRATLLPGTHFSLDGAWPEKFLAIQVGNMLRFGISQDLNAAQILGMVMERLKALPEGTPLELGTTVVSHSSSQGDRPVGTHRYKGRAAGGVWHIEQTYPEADAESLRAALAISAEARECKGFKLRNDEEAGRIQEWCKSNLGAMISDNPPVHEGEFIRLQKPSAGDHLLVGGAVFAVRHGGVWPVFEFAK